MSYRDILVFLDPFLATEARLKLAAKLARFHRARLIGVDISTRAALEDSFHLKADELELKFRDALSEYGVPGDYRVVDGNSQSWKDYYAHFTDLVIASQQDPNLPKGLASDVVESVLLSAGVPVLILPGDWEYQVVGKRIALAWNASREATRAAHDAMPFLVAAEHVTLFEFGPQGDIKDFASDLMAKHLERHGVNVDVQTWADSGDETPISALFASLDENDIDLIVSGAYGHSRLLEGLFGGATVDLLHQPSMPVLMSH